MAVPRSRIVDSTESSLYHCMSRCVRKAFLLESEGDRRRDWLVRRLELLCSALAIDVVSFAVMTNHLHLILRTLPELVRGWSDREVAYRWLLLRPPLRRRRALGLDPDAPPQEQEIADLAGNTSRIAELRKRIACLSWFMKELKEPLARLANREDGVPGRFWQDRFRCHRLLDDEALLCCASYVDLNPVKAGLVEDPLAATHTSVSCHLRRLWAAVARATGRGHGTGDSFPSVDRSDDVIAVLDALDAEDVPFLPAICARREAHLREAADEGQTGAAPPQPSTEDAMAAEGGAAPGIAGSASPARRTSGQARSGPVASHQASDVGRRPALGMTLGRYLKRLREVAAQLARGRLEARDAQGSETRSSNRDRADARSRCGRQAMHLHTEREWAQVDGRSLADALLSLCFWGNAVGSASRLAAEAVRRGTTRVVMALRRGHGPEPFHDPQPPG